MLCRRDISPLYSSPDGRPNHVHANPSNRDENSFKRMVKREREPDEFETVNEISHASPNAKLHGVVSSLLPMKKSKTCSYFDGQVTDGKACIRVFGFDVTVRKNGRSWHFFRKAKVPSLFPIAK